MSDLKMRGSMCVLNVYYEYKANACRGTLRGGFNSGSLASLLYTFLM